MEASVITEGGDGLETYPATVPETAATVPETAGAVPETAATVPETAGALPETAGAETAGAEEIEEMVRVNIRFHPSGILVAKKYPLPVKSMLHDVVASLMQDSVVPARPHCKIQFAIENRRMCNNYQKTLKQYGIRHGCNLWISFQTVHHNAACMICTEIHGREGYIAGPRYYCCSRNVDLCSEHYGWVHAEYKHEFKCFATYAPYAKIFCDAGERGEGSPIYGHVFYHRRGYDEDLCPRHYKLLDDGLKEQFDRRHIRDGRKTDYEHVNGTAEALRSKLNYEELFPPPVDRVEITEPGTGVGEVERRPRFPEPVGHVEGGMEEEGEGEGEGDRRPEETVVEEGEGEGIVVGGEEGMVAPVPERREGEGEEEFGQRFTQAAMQEVIRHMRMQGIVINEGTQIRVVVATDEETGVETGAAGAVDPGLDRSGEGADENENDEEEGV